MTAETREESQEELTHDDWVSSPDYPSLDSPQKQLFVSKRIDPDYGSSTTWPAYFKTMWSSSDILQALQMQQLYAGHFVLDL